MTAPLMILDNLCVNTPCTLDWSGFVGDDRTRRCETCRKNVVNLSAMTRAEAERALADPNVTCVRFVREGDSTTLFADDDPNFAAEPAQRMIITGFHRRAILNLLCFSWMFALADRFARRCTAMSIRRINLAPLNPTLPVRQEARIPGPPKPRKVFMGGIR